MVDVLAAVVRRMAPYGLPVAYSCFVEIIPRRGVNSSGFFCPVFASAFVAYAISTMADGRVRRVSTIADKIIEAASFRYTRPTHLLTSAIQVAFEISPLIIHFVHCGVLNAFVAVDSLDVTEVVSSAGERI